MQNIRIPAVEVFLVAPPMLCWGLERLVQTAYPRMELSGTAPSLMEALPLMESHPPHVVVADIDAEGFGNVENFHSRSSAQLLLLTAVTDVKELDQAVLSGARGFVRKSDAPAVLLKAIEKINDGELWIDRGATGRIFLQMARRKAAEGHDPESSKIATLTMRERQTIIAVTTDASAPAKVIAGRLCISEHTLRNHLTSIYNKLEVSSRLDLYAYATRHSLDKRA